MGWDADSPLVERDTWRVTGHVEVDVMQLQGRRSNPGGYQSLATIGATPIARIEWPNEAYVPFVEVAVGINLLSHTTLQEEKHFSTAFQFGEFLGAGLRFGTGGAHEIGVRLQHMSNADIKKPNDGITFVVVRAAYHF